VPTAVLFRRRSWSADGIIDRLAWRLVRLT
jgi:hypothetical protein